MGNLTFIDSAFPLATYPAADGFCFYAGGDTPHVWTSAEVAVLKATYRYLLPIYVRSNPPGPGAVADVAACVAKLKSLGVPAGALVAWDSEMAVDASYIQAVYADLRAAGYTLIEYASQSVAFAEGNPDGYYWGADWTNVAHLHSGDVVTQYVSFSGYDESEASSSLPFWDTRGPAPSPPAGDATIAEGATGAGVSTAQTRLNVWHAAPAVVVDGDFGPATDTAVKSFQGGHALTVDGIVGSLTWTALNLTPLVAGQLAAPTGLAIDRKRLPLQWNPVAGAAVTGYTVVAYGIDGKAYATATTSPEVTWCVLDGLAPGGTYTVRVWANGGKVAPFGTDFTVTLPT